MNQAMNHTGAQITGGTRVVERPIPQALVGLQNVIGRLESTVRDVSERLHRVTVPSTPEPALAGNTAPAPRPIDAPQSQLGQQLESEAARLEALNNDLMDLARRIEA